MELRIRYRDSALINRTYKKLVGPDIMTRVCGLIVTFVDSLIAARFIGTGAMSAIALVSPIMLFNNCFHDILASGMAPVVIRYKSRGQNREAQRAFGAIAAHAFVGYLFVYALAVVFARDLLQVFTDDQTLIRDGLDYFIPLALFNPFAELGLCFERGFRADGRNGYFGFRAIITNILNVVFSLIAVLALHGGILGISIASNMATICGYFWSFSHIFSSKCTTRPDFSVVLHLKEFRHYLQEEMQIGSVYALDDGLCAAASSMLNKAIIMTGGTPALAAIGIYNSVESVLYSVNNAVQQSSYNLSNLFWSDSDYSGARHALRTAIILEGTFGIAYWAVVNLFPGAIGVLFNVDSEEVLAALRVSLCFSTAAAIADCYTNVFSSYMLASEQKRAAAICAAGHNAALFLAAMIGLLKVSFSTLLCVYMAASILAALLEYVFIATRKKKSAGDNEAEICTYSYTLSDAACAEISREMSELLRKTRLKPEIISKVALLSEECSRLILYTNKDTRGEDDICVDYRFSVSENECIITIIDTGAIFDPVQRMNDSNLPEEFAISRKILQGFSPKASYTRVVDLNLSHLVLELA